MKTQHDITDEERSNNTTPPRTAAGDVSPVDGGEEPRTPEDVSKVQPVNLDNLLEEAAAMFPETPKDSCGRRLEDLKESTAQRSPGPTKEEVTDTTTSLSPWKNVQGVESIDSVPLPKPEDSNEAATEY